MRNNKNKNSSFNRKGWFEENRFILLSMLLTMSVIIFTYVLRGIYPFGSNIVLKVDLYHQYAPFHEELRSRILNGQSLFYSWEGGLGKSFITQFAYYTASPLSFLILLFPQRSVPEALALFISIKIIFCAGLFSYYLKCTFKRNDLSIVAFGILYAFSSYITGYYWNVMWLDAVALFPIVALGIERLIDEDKHLMYCISLAIVIVVNFYIAFIVCVFAVLYYVVVLFSRYSWKKDRTIIIQRTIKFGIISAIAGGISMFLTIPTAIALSHTDTSATKFPKFEIYENVYQLITNHFLGARPVVLARNEDLPNVYTGVVTMILLPFYFFNHKFKTKEKVLYGSLMLFMLLCACIKPLDYLIHGAHFPSNLPHRYTFIYSFIALILAYKGLINIRDVKFNLAYKAFVFFAVIILFTEKVLVPNYSEIDPVLSQLDIVLNIVAMLAYIVVLLYYKESNRNNVGVITSILIVMVLAEVTFSNYEGLDRTTAREDYVKYIDTTKEAINYLDEKENGGFYRTEFRRFTTINDAALYHYNGFSQFSSLASGSISAMIGDLGIAATGNSYRYYDPTSLIDAMFDLKYVMNKADDSGNGLIKNERYTFIKKFENIDEATLSPNSMGNDSKGVNSKEITSSELELAEGGKGNVWIYENPRVLPLGFMVKSSVEEWKTKDSMPFDVQNDFIKKTTGINKNMFTDVKLDSVDYTYMNISEKENENKYKYNLTDPANLSLLPTVTIKIVSDKDQYVYLYIDAGNAKRVKYKKNSVDEDRELSAGKSLFDIGNMSKGEELIVSFELTNKGEFEKTYRKDGNFKVYAASYNDEVFQEAYDKLSEMPFVISSFEDTRIEGGINAKEDGIMFTSIPYDTGWSVSVDGEKEELVSIAKDGVIGVKINAGEHNVVFSYEPPGFYLGCFVTLGSLIVFVVYLLSVNKKKKEIAAE